MELVSVSVTYQAGCEFGRGVGLGCSIVYLPGFLVRAGRGSMLAPLADGKPENPLGRVMMSGHETPVARPFRTGRTACTETRRGSMSLFQE
jgi:hypothetical protein